MPEKTLEPGEILHLAEMGEFVGGGPLVDWLRQQPRSREGMIDGLLKAGVADRAARRVIERLTSGAHLLAAEADSVADEDLASRILQAHQADDVLFLHGAPLDEF
jgi:hypothetical protein